MNIYNPFFEFRYQQPLSRINNDNNNYRRYHDTLRCSVDSVPSARDLTPETTTVSQYIPRNFCPKIFTIPCRTQSSKGIPRDSCALQLYYNLYMRTTPCSLHNVLLGVKHQS